jgi:hypothetical protein
MIEDSPTRKKPVSKKKAAFERYIQAARFGQKGKSKQTERKI